MRCWITLGAVATLFLTGCTHNQLRRSTVHTASTLPDMQYQQILDNLARFCTNSGSLPYFAVTGDGTAQVTDGVSSDNGLDFAEPGGLASGSLGLGAARDVTETWNFATVTSPDKLRSMQGLFRTAIAGRRQGDPGACWFHYGSKRDVPKDACYVGRYRGCYVWVEPEGLGGLSELTLNVLEVATADDTAGAIPELRVHIDSTGGQSTNAGASGLPPMQPLPGVSPAASPFAPGNAPRLDFSGTRRGPIFTPRAR